MFQVSWTMVIDLSALYRSKRLVLVGALSLHVVSETMLLPGPRYSVTNFNYPVGALNPSVPGAGIHDRGLQRVRAVLPAALVGLWVVGHFAVVRLSMLLLR